MANLIQATVYQIDGSPQPAAITLAFPTCAIAIREATVSTISQVASAIRYYSNPSNPLYFQDYFVSEAIATLVTEAEAEQIQTTIFEIDGNMQIPDGVEWSFPPKQISISEYEDTATGVESIITFKGSTYSSDDTEDNLVIAANA